MVRVIFTDHALDNLDLIADYIARDAPKAAGAFVKNVFQKAELLQNSPKLGRKVPEFNKENIRELLCGRYRIVYKLINKNRIDILAVHHGARLLSSDSLFE